MKKLNKIIFSFPIMGIILFFNADSLLAAFEWPWQQASEQKEKTSSVTSSQPTAIVKEKGELQYAVQRINQGVIELKKDSPIASSNNIAKKSEFGVNENAAIAAIKQELGSNQTSFTIKGSKRSDNYAKAVKIQEKLNDLLQLSSGMDSLNRSKVIEVQAMVEKSRMNQDILSKLASPSDAIQKIRKVDAARILHSKKLRAMREEAEKQMALAQSSKNSVLLGSHKTTRP